MSNKIFFQRLEALEQRLRGKQNTRPFWAKSLFLLDASCDNANIGYDEMTQFLSKFGVDQSSVQQEILGKLYNWLAILMITLVNTGHRPGEIWRHIANERLGQGVERVIINHLVSGMYQPNDDSFKAERERFGHNGPTDLDKLVGSGYFWNKISEIYDGMVTNEKN